MVTASGTGDVAREGDGVGRDGLSQRCHGGCVNRRPADGRNYWIGHPGLYVLSCGNVKAVSVLQPIELA